jgi:hypothetical protein
MTMRDQVARFLLQTISDKVEIFTGDKKQVPHWRAFSIRFADHRTLRVRLDEGVSYWRLSPSSKSGPKALYFDFDRVAAVQAKALQTLDVAVEGKPVPQPVFVGIKAEK